jgi:type I restriction enzyme M protein
VVSLPQETFYSAGASVKASLLFMQKFTEQEAADYEAKRQAAMAEVEAEHKAKIESETARLNAAIAEAKQARDADRRKLLQAELRQYLKQAEAAKVREASGGSQSPAWSGIEGVDPVLVEGSSRER